MNDLKFDPTGTTGTAPSNTIKLPDDHVVTCGECEWAGPMSDCGTDVDSEGWEYPTYEIHTCPNCGGGDIQY